MRGVYYNEIDAFAAQWLRNLMESKLIPEGDVDERSICDVQPDDLRGYRQCHFFAGIAGWSRALYLAQWPEDREVWTGSCPCQPLSCAGQQKGHADERHLWPAFYRLISECKPATIFGEQVAGTLGIEWFAGVRADLEDAGYACGGADLCAAGVGAPHIRQRIFWCAVDESNAGGDMGNANFTRLEGHRGFDDEHEAQGREKPDGCSTKTGVCNMLADANLQSGAECNVRTQGRFSPSQRHDTSRSGVHGKIGFWAGAEWIACGDGKARHAKPGLPLLAHGIPNRMGRLRGFGNAIVPQVAAQFIEAVMEVCP